MKYKVTVYSAILSDRKHWADTSFGDVNEAYKFIKATSEEHAMLCGKYCNLSDWRVEDYSE